MEVEIQPEPNDDEREAILAALAESQAEDGEADDAWARAGLPHE